MTPAPLSDGRPGLSMLGSETGFAPPASSLTDRLADLGCWVAVAARRLSEGKYSEVIRICREHQETEEPSLSARLIYARALFRSGQTESAADQFHRVLALDPENVAAYGFLGDICFAAGDHFGALANYGRALEIDPYCHGLKSDLRKRQAPTTRTITLLGRAENHPETPDQLRDIPFYTETIGDIYLAQGHHRLAAAVFRKLANSSDSPRLTEKLSLAEGKIKEKES